MALVTHGADPTRKTHVGLNCLQQAAYEGSFDVTDIILRASSITNQQYNKDADSTSHMSKSALHLALEARHRDVAKLLIRNGIGVNNICGIPPYTPLEWAAKQNASELVEELLAANADPNLVGESIPLLSAASRFVKWENVYDFHDTAVIALLLDAGANPHAANCTFVESLERCIEENTRNKWWREDDPTIWRLRVALALPEDWVAL
jgi:ankyrin repeat protein